MAATPSKWNLAWALYAGVSYNVTKNFKVDLTYRYLNYGSITDTVDCNGGCFPDSFKFDKLYSHDIMLGVALDLLRLRAGARHRATSMRRRLRFTRRHSRSTRRRLRSIHRRRHCAARADACVAGTYELRIGCGHGPRPAWLWPSRRPARSLPTCRVRSASRCRRIRRRNASSYFPAGTCAVILVAMGHDRWRATRRRLPNPTDSKLNQGVTAGLGVGIKSQWVRTDVTLDYASDRQIHRHRSAAPGDITAKIQATNVLFNGYLDLGTWYRHNALHRRRRRRRLRPRSCDYASTGAPPFTGSGKKQWSFAWAAMAGVAWPVAPNLMIDVGYRYLNIGDVAHRQRRVRRDDLQKCRRARGARRLALEFR